MGGPNFTIQKISDHGSTNPIVARLGLQTGEIVQAVKLVPKQRQEVLDLYASQLMRRMLKVHDAHNRAIASRDTAIQDHPANELPFVVGLEDEIDSILVEAKSILRDTLRLFAICFPNAPAWTEAKFYFTGDRAPSGKPERTRDWCADKFGADCRLVRVIEHYQPLVGDVVNFRNAREHPGGHSGTLTIHNFGIREGSLSPPALQYDKRESPSRVLLAFPFLRHLEDGLLYFCEDILAAVARELRVTPQMELVEIPPHDRRAAAPTRLKWTFV